MSMTARLYLEHSLTVLNQIRSVIRGLASMITDMLACKAAFMEQP